MSAHLLNIEIYIIYNAIMQLIKLYIGMRCVYRLKNNIKLNPDAFKNNVLIYSNPLILSLSQTVPGSQKEISAVSYNVPSTVSNIHIHTLRLLQHLHIVHSSIVLCLFILQL